MCGRYQLNKDYEELPSLLKKDLPRGFKEKYSQHDLFRPTDPVLVLKNEGKTTTSIMLWGFISEWAKNPFENERPRPFNARSETVGEKKLFRASWQNKRCLLPASSFLEKNYRINRKDEQIFWLAGLWNRWMSSEGSEIESCCVLTTEANQLIKPFHNRMPVIIPNGLEEEWIAPVKNRGELRALEPLMGQWSSAEWKAELINQPSIAQMNLF